LSVFIAPFDKFGKNFPAIYFNQNLSTEFLIHWRYWVCRV
jgi:hypothetical protein